MLKCNTWGQRHSGATFKDREPSPIHSIIFEQGTDMKYILILSILASLGGCIITPAGHGDNREGYYRERGYDRGDVYSRDDNYRGYRGYPYQDHGG
jgi:hypothetical protein